MLWLDPGFTPLNVSELKPTRRFYRSSVSISEWCCHSTITVQRHPTPRAPSLIPVENWKPLSRGVKGNRLENPPMVKLYGIMWPVAYSLTQLYT